jgi:hypothetical protein
MSIEGAEFVNAQNPGFIPRHGERDEESQFGGKIPYKRWILDVDTFRTRAKNYFHHNSVGKFRYFLPARD